MERAFICLRDARCTAKNVQWSQGLHLAGRFRQGPEKFHRRCVTAQELREALGSAIAIDSKRELKHTDSMPATPYPDPTADTSANIQSSLNTHRHPTWTVI